MLLLLVRLLLCAFFLRSGRAERGTGGNHMVFSCDVLGVGKLCVCAAMTNQQGKSTVRVCKWLPLPPPLTSACVCARVYQCVRSLSAFV